MTTKTIYYFKPADHWNIISFETYVELSKFYGDDLLKCEEIEIEI